VWAGSERAWKARVGAWLLSLPRAGSNVGLQSGLAPSHQHERGGDLTYLCAVVMVSWWRLFSMKIETPAKRPGGNPNPDPP
jgi:hypothetical protein